MSQVSTARVSGLELAEPVIAFPNSLFGNQRTIRRWQLWAIRLTFITLVAGELYSGTYVSDWGLASSRMVGATILMVALYAVCIWAASILTGYTYRKSMIGGQKLILLPESRAISNYRLWALRAFVVVYGLSGPLLATEVSYLIGSLIGVAIIYAVGLHLLSGKWRT